MPLIVNLCLNRKIGLPNYGSVGASCSLQVELPASLIDDHDGLQREAQRAYAACAQAVDDELHRQQGGQPQVAHAEPAAKAETPNGNGHRNGNGAAQVASAKQSDYIRQLAGQIKGLGVRRLESLANKMFGRPLATLTSMDASGLIDALKEIKAGKIELDKVLEGASP